MGYFEILAPEFGVIKMSWEMRVWLLDKIFDILSKSKEEEEIWINTEYIAMCPAQVS